MPPKLVEVLQKIWQHPMKTWAPLTDFMQNGSLCVQSIAGLDKDDIVILSSYLRDGGKQALRDDAKVWIEVLHNKYHHLWFNYGEAPPRHARRGYVRADAVSASASGPREWYSKTFQGQSYLTALRHLRQKKLVSSSTPARIDTMTTRLRSSPWDRESLAGSVMQAADIYPINQMVIAIQKYNNLVGEWWRDSESSDGYPYMCSDTGELISFSVEKQLKELQQKIPILYGCWNRQ